jgi:hypothetical protein
MKKFLLPIVAVAALAVTGATLAAVWLYPDNGVRRIWLTLNTETKEYDGSGTITVKDPGANTHYLLVPTATTVGYGPFTSLQLYHTSYGWTPREFSPLPVTSDAYGNDIDVIAAAHFVDEYGAAHVQLYLNNYPYDEEVGEEDEEVSPGAR